MKIGKRSFIIIFILFASFIWGLAYFDEYVYLANYLVDCLGVFCVVICLFNNSARHGFDIFEPLYFISIIYAMIYFVTPLYDLFLKNYLWFQYNLFPYGIKAGVIAILGYCSFYIIYAINDSVYSEEPWENQIAEQSSRVLVLAIIVMCVICFFANAWTMIHSGYMNLTYILTLGLMGGSGKAADVVENIGFISMITYSLSTSVLLYFEFGKSKLLKVLFFVPMVLLQVTKGFRFFIVQIAVTFFVYMFLKKEKRPTFHSIIIAILIMLIPISFMTLFRDSIRAGMSAGVYQVGVTEIMDSLDEAIWGNFRIYRNFYGVVHSVPQTYSYIGGRQMIYGTLIMAIPRAIWSGKPSSSGGVGLAALVGSNLAGTGMASPNITEYYYGFGILGVIVFMGIYGFWAKRQRQKKMYSSDPFSRIEYAVLLGTNIQLLTRAFTPSNFYYLLFSVLPIIFVRMIYKKR